MRISSEEKLKIIATLYANKEGKSFLAEIEEINRQRVSYITPRADMTVRGLLAKEKRPKSRKMILSFAAAAACVVLAVRLIAGIPDSNNEYYPSDASPAPSSPSVPYMPGEILPISFQLPADYHVMTSDIDNGMSVYKLESESHGDVVLTMYYVTDEPGYIFDADKGFDEVIIDGTPVAAKVKDTFRLLSFESDDIRYTLSSEDDLGALAAFYRNILNFS